MKKAVIDVQLVKESIQDELRGAYDILSVQRMIAAMTEVAKIQQYLKLAFLKSPEVAARFAQATDAELDFSTADMAKIASLEKEVDKLRGYAAAGGSRKRSIDKVNDVCNLCNAVGHWKFDRDSSGKYVCPKQK